MLSSYRGNSGAASPSTSGKAILVTLSDVPTQEPITIAFADSPYTIANTDVSAIRTFLVSTAGGAVTINLPAVPFDGEIVTIKRTTPDGTALTIGRNGKNIEGAAANFSDANAGLSSYQFQYDSTSGSWWWIGG